MALPQQLDALTPAFLTDALRAAGSLRGDASVVSFESTPVGAGVGFVGILAKLALSYTPDAGPDAPSSLIAKIPTPDPNIRAMLKPTRIFEREARFFAEIAPNSNLRVPKPYLAAFDLDADEYLLLLEDLGDMTIGDQRLGITVEQARIAVQAIAKLHAQYWGCADWDWLPDVNAPINAVGEQIYAASLPGFTQVFGHLLTPEMQSIAQRFGDNVPQLLGRIAAMPNTLVHLDYRSDNIFFGSAPGQAPVAAIDFQSISRGGGVYDVAYLLSQNLSVEDRRAHEDDLLVSYHEALVALGVSGYSIDEVRAGYRVGVLYGWIIPVFAVGSLDVSSERAMGLWTNVIGRAQQAILDHNCAELLTK